MQLSEYNEFEEKIPFFEMVETVNKIHYSPDSFFNILDRMYSENSDPANPKYIFRGLPEAKYKLYNSAQREFYGKGIFQLHKDSYESENILKKLLFYIDWLNGVREESLKWNGSVVEKLLCKQNHNSDILQVLSYLRHYGVPTPIIDFTLNPYVALFFAIEEIEFAPSNKEIDNYLSLYTIDVDYLHLCADKFKGTELYNKIYKPNEHYNPFNIWTNSNSGIFTNLNIINQEGCLISNIHLADSLENTYKLCIDQINNISPIKGYGLNSKRIISCYNIHKGWVPFILQKLNEKNITSEFIYPDPYSIKNKVTSSTLIKILSDNPR